MKAKKKVRPLTKKQIARRDEILCEHMPLAEKIIASYLRTHPDQRHLQDDMVSSAYWRMTNAANTYVRTGKYVKNIKGYMRFAARTGIGEVIRIETTILKPRYCPAKRVKDRDIQFYYGEISGVPSRAQAILDTCCADDEDRALLQLLFEGVSIPKICMRMKITEKEFAARRRVIAKRYEQIES